jgi:hypothetical protein
MLAGTSSKNSVDKLAVLIAEHFKENENHQMPFRDQKVFYLKVANGFRARIFYDFRTHRFGFSGLYNPGIGLDDKLDFSSTSLREVCIHVRGTSLLSLKSMVYVRVLVLPYVEISIGFFEHFGTIKSLSFA